MAKMGVIVSTLAGPGQSQCLAKIKGREVFMRTLDLFITRDDVCVTLLLVGEDRAEQIKKKYGPHLAFASVKVITGKDHFEGVAAAVEEIPGEAELIAVHDAARPAISAMQIDELAAAAAKDGAAILAAPIRQNIRKVDKDKKISAILSSANLWFAQTPQIFKAKVLRDAYAKRAEFSASCADDADLVAAAGTAATVLVSSWRNIRIATSDDITVACPIIDAVPKPKLKGPSGPYAEDKMW